MAFEVPFLAFIQSLRNAPLNWLMDRVEFLTSGQACVACAALIAGMLAWQRKRGVAVFLFFGTCFGSLTALVLKHLFRRVRPEGATLLSFSFPSGHAVSSCVFFGLLAYLGSRADPRRKWLYWTAATFGTAIVGFNRMYLGAHWPTDVLAGWLVGAGFLTVWIRKTDRHLLGGRTTG
jgi:membrane-associated phospholipid phosphatase